MKKIGYALVDIRDGRLVNRWHGTLVDANGHPQMCFRVPGTMLDVHSPQIGAIYENHHFVERYQHDPGAPSPWHSSIDVESYDGKIALLERRYSDRPDIVPSSVSIMQARLALMRAKLLDRVSAEIAALDPSDEANRGLQIMWEYASELSRRSPELDRVAKIIGLSDAEVDDLFRAAAGG